MKPFGCTRHNCEYAHGPTHLGRFLEYLGSARRTLDVCVFTITCEVISTKVIDLFHSGVKVRPAALSQQACALSYRTDAYCLTCLCLLRSAWVLLLMPAMCLSCLSCIVQVRIITDDDQARSPGSDVYRFRFVVLPAACLMYAVLIADNLYKTDGRRFYEIA